MAPFTENSSTVRISNERHPQFASPPSMFSQPQNASHLNVRPCQESSGQHFTPVIKPNTYQSSIVHQGVSTSQPPKYNFQTQYIGKPAPASPSISNLKSNSSSTSTNIVPPISSHEFIRPSTVPPVSASYQHGLPPTQPTVSIPAPQKSSIHPIPVYSPFDMLSMSSYPLNVPMYFHPAPHPVPSAPSRIRSPSPSPTPSEDSELTFIDESMTHSEYGKDSLITPETPAAITQLILDTIGVRPYDLENDIRSPELFIDQFETYADLLELNETQKRVLFAGLAYNDDESCFEAIKFDTTYYDMKTNFPIVMRNLELRRMNAKRIEAAASRSRSSFMKRTRKFFGKWFK